jgi:hypothetical protein
MLNKFPKPFFHGWRYRQLFWSIIALFLFVSFVDIPFAANITSFLLSLTIFLMVRTAAVTGYWRRILNGLIIGALGGSISNILIQDHSISQKISTFADVIFVIFLGVAIATLSRQLNGASKVDQDIITGAICVYLLIGIFWFLLYRIVFNFNPENFIELQENEGNPDFTLLYFSFTTLTTVGYGDITPTASAAMGLANLESIVGQLYPAIFVARLVSLYTVTLQDDGD